MRAARRPSGRRRHRRGAAARGSWAVQHACSRGITGARTASSRTAGSCAAWFARRSRYVLRSRGVGASPHWPCGQLAQLDLLVVRRPTGVQRGAASLRVHQLANALAVMPIRTTLTCWCAVASGSGRRLYVRTYPAGWAVRLQIWPPSWLRSLAGNWSHAKGGGHSRSGSRSAWGSLNPRSELARSGGTPPCSRGHRSTSISWRHYLARTLCPRHCSLRR